MERGDDRSAAERPERSVSPSRPRRGSLTRTTKGKGIATVAMKGRRGTKENRGTRIKRKGWRFTLGTPGEPIGKASAPLGSWDDQPIPTELGPASRRLAGNLPVPKQEAVVPPPTRRVTRGGERGEEKKRKERLERTVGEFRKR